MVTEREPVGKMIAEVFREIGLLFLTFIPLDAVFEHKPLETLWFWTGLHTPYEWLISDAR